jgi:hypothetical protein
MSTTIPTREELRRKFNNETTSIIEQREENIYLAIQALPTVEQLVFLWESADPLRSTSFVYDWFPQYIFFRLAPSDSLSKSIHLFLEEAVDLFLLKEDAFEKTSINSTTIEFWLSSPRLRLVFDPEKSEHCTIITEEKPHRYVEKRIFC